jgi:DNA transposition AAA+ family ATPase
MALRNQKQNHFVMATLTALVVLMGFTSAHAQSRCAEIFSKSATRTEVRNDFITTNTFTVSRTLEVYSQHFPFKATESLKDTVEQLPQGSVWVDMGAREARALIDGLKANPRISEGVAIAY